MANLDTRSSADAADAHAAAAWRQCWDWLREADWTWLRWKSVRYLLRGQGRVFGMTVLLGSMITITAAWQEPVIYHASGLYQVSDGGSADALRSERVLRAVIHRLDLLTATSAAPIRPSPGALSGSETVHNALVRRLQEVITVRPLNHLGKVEVSVRSENPYLAARIANGAMEEHLGIPPAGRDFRGETIGVVRARLITAREELAEREAAAQTVRHRIVTGVLLPYESASDAARKLGERTAAATAAREEFLAVRARLEALSGPWQAQHGLSRILQPASAAKAEREHSWPRTLLGGFAAFLSFGFLAAAGTGLVRRPVLAAGEVRWLTGISLITSFAPPTRAREAGRQNAQQFLAAIETLQHWSDGLDQSRKRVLAFFDAPLGGEACPLAIAFCREMPGAAHKVVLIDIDQTNPTLHKRLSGSNGFGVSDALAENAPITEALQRHRSTGLAFVSAGSPDAPRPTVLGVKRMIRRLQQRFDVVVVVADARSDSELPALLSGRVDGAVLVASPGVTSPGSLTRAARVVSATSDQCGVVLVER